MRPIATRVSQLNGEGALAVFARAKELEKEGRSIIHLELGEPDFHPAAPIVDASIEAAVDVGVDAPPQPITVVVVSPAVCAVDRLDAFKAFSVVVDSVFSCATVRPCA